MSNCWLLHSGPGLQRLEAQAPDHCAEICFRSCGVQLDPMIGPGTSRSYKWWEEAELKYA